MEKQRIQVYADPEIKRRIELAAAKHKMSVTEYCLSAIQQQLADDGLLEAEHTGMMISPTKQRDNSLIISLRALHQEILDYGSGKRLDVDAELEKIREERGYELSGLH